MKCKHLRNPQKAYAEGSVDGYVVGYWDGYYNRGFVNEFRMARFKAKENGFKGESKKAYIQGFKESYLEGHADGREEAVL